MFARADACTFLADSTSCLVGVLYHTYAVQARFLLDSLYIQYNNQIQISQAGHVQKKVA